jgi:membrane fusion protein (multidrug efflux system)
MAWLRKTRSLLVAAGGVLLIGSLLGARLLGPGGGGGGDSTGKAPPPPPGKEAVGTVVLGTADSDPSPVSYALPPVLPSGRVAEVFVRQGDDVRAGDKLYRFDAQILQAKLTEAEAAVGTAQAELAKARGALEAYDTATLAPLAHAVKVGEEKVKLALKARQVGTYQMTEKYKDSPKLKEILDNDPELYNLYVKHAEAELERDFAKVKHEAGKVARDKQVAPLVAVATAELNRYEKMVAEAKAAVESCTIRAEQDGVVERVSVGKGDTLGVSSRTPAMILIPAGPRVIRARVEAEFAHKIGPSQKGKTVTIHDFTDPKVSYQGRVREIGNSFLPRRGNESALVQNETRALEVVIDVLDPAPPGRPPLRVGQEVRVHFSP